MQRSWLAATLLTLLGWTPLHAQDAIRVQGRVLDQTGGALPGVTVDLAVRASTFTTTTTATGEYRLEGVPSGDAELTFRLLNFGVARRTLRVPAEGTAAADVVLHLSLNSDVVVPGAATFRNVADVEDPAGSLVGIAASASQGAITANQIDSRVVHRVGEVLEVVPGLIVSQHSGEGKANQYYLRGFNLDHGTDFATTVAGVPVNMPTGAHAHGYSDASFLLPELVGGVQFRKGPYYADEGDFSAAGAAAITYINQLDRPIVRLSGGSHGWARAFAAASPDVSGGHLLAAIELTHHDGPWTRPDDYGKVNGLLRFSRGDSRNGLSVTGMSSTADWQSTDQIPRRAVSSGAVSRFGLLDATDGGSAGRHSVSAELQRSNGPSAWRATGYLLHNRLNLLSNFTYFLENPEDGDQFEQAERRIVAGGRATYRRLGHLGGQRTESAVGLQIRHDMLRPVGLYHTAGGRRLSTTREDRVGQTAVGVNAQTEIEWTRAFRTTFGVRTDVHRFAVDSNLAANSGEGSAGLVSPKFGAAFSPSSGTEIYVNAGAGFHSNDARGATIRIDPRTGAAVDRVTPLVRARGAEVGVRTVRVKGLQSTAVLWYLGLDSELVFVGDAGTTEAGRPSRRFGFEWTNYVRLSE